jgi:signal transduction histidine kinase
MPFFYSRKHLEEVVAKETSEACDVIINQMGAELHDDLIQKLSVFRLYIDQIERSCADPAAVELLALKMRSDFEQVVSVVRNTSRRLLPAKMEGETLDSTLAMLCQNMEHPGTGHIHFKNNGNPRNISSNLELHLFRIVQELIHNAFKHSAAWHIYVRLYWNPDNLLLEVEDDGSGFSKVTEFVEKLKTKHNTLRMRALTIGANIEYIQGAKGLLARVTVKV